MRVSIFVVADKSAMYVIQNCYGVSMSEKYYVMYNPLNFNLMEKYNNKTITPIDIISYITNKNAENINESNYLNYLQFDLKKERQGLIEHFGLKNYASYYLSNQISKIDKKAAVIIADGKNRTLYDIIKKRGNKPGAVFITSISSNFPTAAITALVLNYAKIPVVIGGIHVSVSRDDINTYIRKYAPYKNIISQVTGPGDFKVLSEILSDIENNQQKEEYFGFQSVEDGNWGQKNVFALPDIKLNFLKKIPVIGHFFAHISRITPITPYLGCPYSCNFCSVSSLPVYRRKFIARSADDFVNEIKNNQKKGNSFSNRVYFFLPDNILLGGKKLHAILDKLIESKIKINYASQISVDIANDITLLKKLRKSGASHFFIGFESLDIRNLEYIGKNSVKEIKKSGLSIEKYYSQKIKVIQDHGISVHGAFIFGLPFDYFNNLNDHTGIKVADFCVNNKIGLQPTSLNDLPGSKNFMESQENSAFRYGKQGTMEYFTSLCLTDLTESNRAIADSLKNSPLIVFYMAYEAMQKVGSDYTALTNGFYTAGKSLMYPTQNGCSSLSGRIFDSLSGLGFQIGISTYKNWFESVAYSKDNIRGSFERLYNIEKNPEVKAMFKKYIKRFAFSALENKPLTIKELSTKPLNANTC